MQAVAHERETSNWCGRAANLHGFKAWKREQVIPSPCSTWVSQKLRVLGSHFQQISIAASCVRQLH